MNTDARRGPLRKRLPVSFVLVISARARIPFPSAVPLSVLVVLAIPETTRNDKKGGKEDGEFVSLGIIDDDSPFVLINQSGYGVVVLVIPDVRLTFRISGVHLARSTVAAIAIG